MSSVIDLWRIIVIGFDEANRCFARNEPAGHESAMRERFSELVATHEIWAESYSRGSVVLEHGAGRITDGGSVYWLAQPAEVDRFEFPPQIGRAAAAREVIRSEIGRVGADPDLPTTGEQVSA